MTEGESIPTYQRLWAKTSRGGTQTHPLICHLIDVAQVALALWESALTAGIRRQFAGTLGLDPEGAGRTLAFWAGLHDLGKATPAFQRRLAAAVPLLRGDGLDFALLYVEEPFYHGTATARLLADLLASQTGVGTGTARKVARAVGGHHGAWPIPAEMQALKSYQLGGSAWDAVRRDLVQSLHDLLVPGPMIPRPWGTEGGHALVALLSGLTSVADWIGSMEDTFPFAQVPLNLAEYHRCAAARAQEALARLHWVDYQPPREPVTFGQLFGLPGPRPMQAQVIELAARLDRPALVLIEAPTGVGKTEAALYLADHWARTLQQRGLYVAMPSMATSNQMHGRACAVLARRYPALAIRPLLVHGQARWVRTETPPAVTTVGEGSPGGADEAEVAAWFLPRKRSLLAPFGVGTVDQAFLSVLQTRHFFVRLFGLSHKTVIFDEVHAYDTYMSALFLRLLGWLRALGTSVVVLSATLPAETRRALLAAYAGGAAAEAPLGTYPAINWAMEGQCGAVPVQASGGRTVAVEWVGRDPAALAAGLRVALAEGGCAAVICNTVARAQEVARVLRAAGIVPEDDLLLFHARFPFGWRQEIEERVLARFGKEGQRPRRAIVVATQVVEQSLDLDFDLMFSDLAPVDLLIQRAGRLHRHEGRARPAPVAAPRLWIGHPAMEGGVPQFGHDAWVYEPYVLLRSYLALRDRDRMALPQDTTALIEAVYGEGALHAGELAAALSAARRRMAAHRDQDTDAARRRLIAPVDADDLMSRSNAGLAEDAPAVHEALQALTRLGPPSLSVACLHRIGGGLNTEPDGSGVWIDLDRPPDAEITEAIVESSVDVSHRGVFGALVGQEVPRGWREHALLQRYRALVFQQGLCSLPGVPYTFRLTREQGLEIVPA